MIAKEITGLHLQFNTDTIIGLYSRDCLDTVPGIAEFNINAGVCQKNMTYKFTYKTYADALYEALCEDPFYITLEKSIEDAGASRDAMLEYMDFSMIEGLNFGELYLPKDHKYGVSIWSKPLENKRESKKKKEKKRFLLNQLGGKALNTYLSIVDYMSEKAEPLLNKNLWYLSIVGILPRFQGQGFGPGLIEDVLSKMDSLGIATYLETFTQRNIRFYKRLGYQVVDSFNEPTTQADYWLMVREPQNPKDRPGS